MGVPKLSQDLAPYAETAILGDLPVGVEAVQVKNLVIDGPSMVYHVYNALERACIAPGGSIVNNQPSYRQINECCLCFLTDLEMSGVVIDRVFFDGALPIRKRQIRRDRLEKTRQQLAMSRRTHLRPVSSQSILHQAQRSSSNADSNHLYRHALWGDMTVMQPTSQRLLPPPFMVPAVIESLRQSRWSDITRIVPGEADGYCACEASESGSAILSNDSDLVLYDLGLNGVVVAMHSLQKLDEGRAAQVAPLKAQCLRPLEVAKMLRVPDMLTFGFHRLRDVTVRSAVIAQRAREDMPAVGKEAWVEFRAEYRRDCPDTTCAPQITDACPLIQNLDPRVSELVCSCSENEDIHMYLPMVLEDPGRDSSWGHGSRMRRLAYSVLLKWLSQRFGAQQQGSVIEFFRKGDRIVENKVSILSEDLLNSELAKLSDLAIACHQENAGVAQDASDAKPKLSTRREGSSSSHQIISTYYIWAARIVMTEHTQRLGSEQNASCHWFVPSSDEDPISAMSGSWTWSDLHRIAVIQCTLYSLRLLKQVFEITDDYPAVRPTDGAGLPHLVHMLHEMPPIADLLTKATGLRRKRLRSA